MAQSNFTSINDLVFPFRNYVLALPGWYPTWTDALPGDFNQRHIIAASHQTPQIVLYVGKDQSGTVKKIEVRYHQLAKNVIEVCVLYPKNRVEFLDKFQSNLFFFRLFNKYAALIKKRWGAPKLLHSYIVVRGGVAGWLLARKWRLPFVLTENWTIYYPEDPGYLLKRDKVFKWAVNRVYDNMARFLPVTNNLNDRVQTLLKKVPFTVVPNVVETEIFFYKDKSPSRGFRFVHVSTMLYQKNPQGLLRSFKAFHDLHPKATLLMVGPYPDDVKKYATALGFTDEAVRFTGAVAYKKVAELLHSSDALVLFSRYENLPCVILEALCCGMPVISTSVGGIAEVIDNENGLLIEPENEKALRKALIAMYTQHENYDLKKIAETAFAKFSYEAVGKQINAVYDEVLGNTNL